MSLWSRIANLLRGDRLSREIDEELRSHIEEAIDQGRDPGEARRAFGSALRTREGSRDVRLIPWLDSLRADTVFGWRRLNQTKVTSAAAILSLALAIGACTATFRLIDAIFLRPLPVAGADRLQVVAFQGANAMTGKTLIYDSCSYPMFRRMRANVRDQAELVAVSYADRVDLTFASDQEMEKAYSQFVSGWMFPSFGLHPALGRLLSENDDRTPGAHPVAVVSYEYWERRFGKDPKVLGRTFRMGDDLYEIVGVVSPGFTGTETGIMTDIFVPMMMKNPRTLESSNNFWLRTLVELKPGVSAKIVRDQLAATFRTIQEERVKGIIGLSKRGLDQFFSEKLLLEPAAAGRSNMQRDYGPSLTALGVLVALVLLIACANVANLMTARAAARAREMALRVSIGAGRSRLVQLVLVESALLAFLATLAGAAFAWWSAPLVVGMIDSQLALPADWRVLGFALALALGVTFLFGLPAAFRASSVEPASALKGGDDPHSRRRLMHALIAVQVAFCFLILFVAGLFVNTANRLSKQPTGFSSDRILNLEAITRQPQPAVYWDQVAAHLRSVPGVEMVSMSGWPVMSGESSVSSVAIQGAPATDVMADYLSVSPDWRDTLKIPLLEGRDFRPGDASPSVAIVNQAFAKQYFDGANPVGKFFERVDGLPWARAGGRTSVEIVGYVADARYRDNMRVPVRPMFYIPMHALGPSADLLPISRAAFVVRTSIRNPLSLASILRQEVPRARPEVRVTNIRTQNEIIQSKTVRERLLAMLALFFAVVALLLAGVGLYGVLDYSVLQRRREIGIRMAIGAQAGDIARSVTVDVFSMVLAGAIAGLALGIASVRYIDSLLYQVRASDPGMLALPWLTILTAALLAAAPAVIRAVRIDPVAMLRAD
jgi:putative ABC transport system permease protein